MTQKAIILTIVSSLMLTISCTYQYTFATNPSKLAQTQPSLKATEIPKYILSDAAKRSHTQASAWKIDKIQNVQWSGTSGDGPSRPITGTVPVENYTFGWKVLISSPQQRWVYYATKNQFEFDAPKSVPSYLVEEAIKTASIQTGKPQSNFRLHWAELVTWDDTCLGVTITKPACEKTPVLGWRISLMESYSTLYTFHSRFDTDVRFAGSSPWLPPPSANPAR